ncbi:MAG: hypothetical protein A3J55_03915 [Candidatus Ryanbacteria bacterium RIFCSPHIGHO2_02_FULL_45_17b]|uniref:Uncharacterized protein n=1 Tax=Candidatus Ryanbacteria bacterium RIFCSPHIGHO2_01_FULL_45_22 TaxID=1802114 RepID=A0A1G2FXH8_9BACT|nr:MAG: hypothetical protein A2719_02050 [Candidatus Ryanbacteria bacterium RIFCSPHIGHO2_01_FULL_45_22]OGZ46425.1 MAG: hypothetical protein A3J55_03915 [Candidatus Ryanbacteria bacterium RIFCSPHIGHO2_02_FULL_45_17b]
MINKNFLIFIVVALLMLGVVYYYSTLSENEQTGSEPLSDDASVGVLEQELVDTDLDNLDQEFADIEMELEASISEAR